MRHRSRAAKAPVAAPAKGHEPLWRSVHALAESLNGGAKVQTFTAHAIRHYVRFAAINGLAPHVRRLGSKILIDEIGFREWIGAQPTPASNAE